MTSTVPIDEPTALAWYEFVQERLAEELHEAYPTTDSTPAVDAYREQYRAVQANHQDLVDALHRSDPMAAEEHLGGLKDRARKWVAHPGHPEAKR
ncbi:hypothetical protein [Streptomyces sp. MBT33]|uniref:hypothetical protein n=1 Tax=Streptomyces sp. MBT33 TaxID=1488363 RepID=UPI00190CC0FB|nr:hypothetical protein [Streptomyces sp. MBT33]MBK3639507.1 hypothetical protein [Streptomyces sp. MBT33]